MSNKAELLKKIKALADRGVDGERENAQTLLTRLMEQYGISETEIEEERRETAWFPYSQETERRLLNQIIYMVTGAGGFGCVGEYSGRKRKKMGTECTAAERLEIEANYAFFKEAMKKELEIFYSACPPILRPFWGRRRTTIRLYMREKTTIPRIWQSASARRRRTACINISGFTR